MTVPWRVAKSLLVLRDQVKAAYPGTPNPGFIGDADHASRDSDHNPWVDDPASSLNVVTAGDWYNRPADGFSSAGFAEILRLNRDPRIKYVISERRIFRSYGKTVNGRYYAPFTWAPYDGDNPHTGHTHVSVSSTKTLYDDTRLWIIRAQPRRDEMTEEQMRELKTYIDQRMQAYSFWLDMRARRAELLAAQAEGNTEAEKVLQREYDVAYASWKADQS